MENISCEIFMHETKIETNLMKEEILNPQNM
jgi:hypothetical protein